MSASADIARGRSALVAFHNQALSYPQNYKMTLQQLVDELQRRSRGVFLEGFGFAIHSAELSDAVVNRAMVELATQGQGRLPLFHTSFFSALNNSAQRFSFSDAFSATAKGTVEDLGRGIQAVGDTTISTLKNAQGLVVLLPLLGFAGLAFYIYLVAKKRS